MPCMFTVSLEIVFQNLVFMAFTSVAMLGHVNASNLVFRVQNHVSTCLINCLERCQKHQKHPKTILGCGSLMHCAHVQYIFDENIGVNERNAIETFLLSSAQPGVMLIQSIFVFDTLDYLFG